MRLCSALALVLLVASSCGEQSAGYAKSYTLDTMAQAIGGPAAAARPGDFVLENDRLRAVVHGRHNARGTLPIGNGSLVDLDLQRPHHRYGAGQGKDAFYEFAPFVNLKLNGASEITHGPCDQVGASPCPPLANGAGAATSCARISVKGEAIDLMGILSLLDLAIVRAYPTDQLHLVTDYDLCPGESFLRVTTRARFYGASGDERQMPELQQPMGLLEALLGQYSDADCRKEACSAERPHCDDLLKPLDFGSLSTVMKRCRSAQDGLAGIVGGDMTLFSAKARVFIPGNGFDNDSHIRSIFDAGGDVFSNPLALDYLAATGDSVSYAFFNAGGKLVVPVFSASFTAAMTNHFACSRDNPDCFKGQELVFRRYISVGDGSVGSALEPFYTLRGVATGGIKGALIDQRSQDPLSARDIFVFSLPKGWESQSDSEVATHSYTALVAAHRAETRGARSPLGEAGMVSHFRTDPGMDFRPDGSFGGRLPVGRFVLVAREQGRSVSKLVPITIVAGQTVEATLVAPDPATVDFEVRDDVGNLLPSKLTIGACLPDCGSDRDCGKDRPHCDADRKICVAENPSGPEACRPDQLWDGRSCSCPTTARMPLELGGHRYSDGTVRTVLSADGRGSFELPPGTYELLASRGIEYEISRRFLTLKAGTRARFATTLAQVVKTEGWVSADFHVHGPNSVDSGLDHEARIRSYAAEGVELVSSSDHDHLTDYQPTIFRLGLQRWLTSQVGVECSPLDYGHYLGFPLLFNENDELNGGFHWLKNVPGGSPDWQNRPPAEIFELLRERGAIEQTMVVIAHFYDAFSFYDIDPFTLEPPFLNVSALFNSVLSGRNFSGNFDGLEALSGKNLDVIRRPTYREIRDFNNELAALLAQKDVSAEELQLRWQSLSGRAQRRFLERTPEEQALALSYDNRDFECRCMADNECGNGGLCDRATGACFNGCKDDSDCDQSLVAAGRERCEAVGAAPERRRCQRVALACRAENDCTTTWGGKTEQCVAPNAAAAKFCELPCSRDGDCSDRERPICSSDKLCVAKTVEAAGDHAPCVTVRGTIDDWFQILNRGMRRTVFGNSDSHDLYENEAGLPRNYVRSSAEQAFAIDKRELTENLHKMRSFATYGPFVEFRIDGQLSGSIVRKAPGEAVKLAIRVQSPRWFDVDRLEIYRSGQLWKVISGKADCPEGSDDCIQLPNPRVVNYEATLSDSLQEDAWYVVIAMGLDGKTLAPVYSSAPVARLGMFELIQRLTPILPPLAAMRIPLTPTIGVIRPYAVTNPIYVDVDGDGAFTPKLASPSWMPVGEGAASSTQNALSQPGGAHGHEHPHRQDHQHQGAGHSHDPAPKGRGSAPQASGLRDRLSAEQRAHLAELHEDGAAGGHDHRRGFGRATRAAQAFTRAAKQGAITERMWRRAFDAVRHLGHGWR